MTERRSDPSKTRASLERASLERPSPARPSPEHSSKGRTSRRRDGAAEAPPSGPRGSAWRHAIEVEEALRPMAAAADAERRAGLPYARLAASVAATGAVAVLGSIVLYRRELARERLARPPQLQGEPVAGIPAFVRPRIAVAAWQDSTGAMGCAMALWLVVVAIPRTRRLAMRWAAVPALIGAGAWLGARWFFT